MEIVDVIEGLFTIDVIICVRSNLIIYWTIHWVNSQFLCFSGRGLAIKDEMQYD